MRGALILMVGTLCVSGLHGQPPGDTKASKNFGIEADLDTFPQGMPKDTLGSVLLAASRNRLDYLLAQLTDPEWVQKRVKEVDGSFAALVKETKDQLTADPTELKDLQRLFNEGEWENADTTASAHVTDLDRRVFFRKIGDRWFLENRTK